LSGALAPTKVFFDSFADDLTGTLAGVPGGGQRDMLAKEEFDDLMGH